MQVALHPFDSVFCSFTPFGMEWIGVRKVMPARTSNRVNEAIEPWNRGPTYRGAADPTLSLSSYSLLPGVCNRTEIEEAPSLSQQSPEFVRQPARPPTSLRM